MGRHAICVLNVAVVIWLDINTQTLHNTVLMPFCFGFTANAKPTEWVNYAATDKSNRYFHASQMVLLRETHHTQPSHWLFLNCMCFKWPVTELNHSQLHGGQPFKAVRVHLICHVHCNAKQSMNGRYTEYNLYEFKQLCIVRMLKSNDEISNLLRSTK